MNIVKYVKNAFGVYIFDEKSINEVKNNKQSLLNAIPIIIFLSIIISVITFYFQQNELKLLLKNLNIIENLTLIIFLIIVVLLIWELFTSFFYSSWSHVFIKLFNGKNNYLKTLEVFFLLSIPYLFINTIILSIFSFLEFIYGDILILLILNIFLGLAILIYYIIVIVNTISKTHNMSLKTTIIAGFVSTFTFIIIFTIIFIIVVFLIAVI